MTLPQHPIWEAVAHMSEQYGSDVINISMLGMNLVFLNSEEAADDLLEKRSSIYSDRPVDGMTMLKDLVGMGWAIPMLTYGHQWRGARKAFQREFRASTVGRFRPVQLNAARVLIKSTLNDPESLMAHLRHAAGRVIMDIAYGIDVKEKNDHFVKIAEHALEGGIDTGVPGTYLVDIFPFLRYVPEWIPGAGFKRKARLYRESVMAMLHEPYNYVHGRMDQGIDVPDSAAKSLIENEVGNAEDPEHTTRVCKAVLGSMYIAGSDTTVSAMKGFVLAMVLHPEVQIRAQQEIDRVCQGRLPDFDDYDDLPYVHAMVKEVLRWCPTFALNIPHKVMYDDIYKGYLIPKGSMVISNHWAMLYNPADYPDPHVFNPDRYLKYNADGSVEVNTDVRDPREIAFGFGRRKCPGRYMAYESVWIEMVNVLSSFTLSKKKDAQGRVITPPMDLAHGVITHLKPFPFHAELRSARHGEMILNSFN